MKLGEEILPPRRPFPVHQRLEGTTGQRAGMRAPAMSQKVGYKSSVLTSSSRRWSGRLFGQRIIIGTFRPPS